MQWGQIKTLFILCFLVLNVYLFMEFYEKQKRPDVMDPQIESTIEEQLEQDNIKLPKLSEAAETEKEPFITVEQKVISDEELKVLNKLDNQTYTVVDDKLIVSLFEDAVHIPDDASDESITELVHSFVPYLDQYIFWEWNHDLNVLIFFQEKSERPIYYNQNGLVLVFLNEENEMEFYSQTILDEEEARQEERTLITPIKAIETLYNSGELLFGDEVDQVHVGFHTRIPSTNGVQVFVPTWKVTVNQTKNYFVNAIEGFIFYSNDHEFLENTITDDLEKVQTKLNDKNKLKGEIIKQYKQKLELLERGGEEYAF